MRSLTPEELNIIDKLLDQCAFDSTNLRIQARGDKVCNVNPDGSIVRFKNQPLISAAPAPRIHFVPVEAFVKDTDGVTIHVLLHIREGKIYELEYVKEDSSQIQKWPRADDLIDFLVVQ